MPRRFTTSDKWDDEWYRSLKPIEKIVWEYLITKCDNAGVWRPDFPLMSFCIGETISPEIIASLNNGKERISILSNGYWHIIDFVSFQNYSGFNPKNKAHIGIARTIKSHLPNGYTTDDRFIPDISIDTSIDVSLKGISKGKGVSKKVGKEDTGLAKNPLIEDIRKYCLERKNDVDPQKWHDFYSAKGWMIGKNKMKDWKACVRTWENRKSTAPNWSHPEGKL